MPGVPTYPQILLDTEWQKHKGVIAKIVKGETGIGAKLKRLYDVHTKETKWYVFDPKMPGSPGKPRTRDELNQRMAAAALDLATAAKSIDMSPFEDIRKEIERTEEVGRKMLADWVKSCEEGIKKVRATPTLAEYEASLHQKVRGLNTALARIPDYQDWGDKNWKALAQDKFRAGKQDGEPIKQLATVVDTQLQKFKTVYK